MKRSLTVILTVLLIAGMTLIVTSRAAEAQAAAQKKAARAHAQATATHPHLYDAYRLLKRAHYVLNHACHRLGGHREAAEQQIHLGLGELEAAIVLDHGTVPEVSEAEAIRAVTGQVHPYVHDALRQCKEARDQLQAAEASGGHRDKAIQYIDAAIVQLQAADQEPACT